MTTSTITNRPATIITPAGTHYHHSTPRDLITLLESLRISKRKVRIFLGDTATGEAWAEECDCHGQIGRSMGPMHVPLMVEPRADGGPQLLDHCIVGVLTAPGVWAWKHSSLDLGTWTLGTAVETFGTTTYKAQTYHNGTLHSRHTSVAKAQRLLDFMTGKRMAP